MLSVEASPAPLTAALVALTHSGIAVLPETAVSARMNGTGSACLSVAAPLLHHLPKHLLLRLQQQLIRRLSSLQHLKVRPSHANPMFSIASLLVVQ